MTASRIFSTIGAGWTGCLLYNNQDAAVALARSVGSSALSTLASKPAVAETAALQALAAQVAHLSALIAVQQRGGGDGGNRTAPVVAVLAVGGGALAYTHLVRGLSLSDLLYVTRAQFRGGVATIGAGAFAAACQHAGVEGGTRGRGAASQARVFVCTCSLSVRAGLTALSAGLQRVKVQLTEQLDHLTGRVGDVQEKQKELADELAGTRGDIEEVATALGRLEAKQAEGNRGIFLLCAAVQSLFGSSKSGGGGDERSGRPELSAGQLRELQAATPKPEPFQCVSLEDQLKSIAALTRTLEGCA